MAVSHSRRIAFEILLRVESEGSYASELLHAKLTPDVLPVDAALATELTMGVLRWRRTLDFILDRYLKKPTEQLDLPVAVAMRMGAYQIRFLSRVPQAAAVNESVELVKQARKSSASGLVNAVLRRTASEAGRPISDIIPNSVANIERLGVTHSYPDWMVRRWVDRVGERRAVEWMNAGNRTPKLSCAIADEAQLEEIKQSLEREKLRCEPGSLLKSSFSVVGGNISRSSAFREGRISIQDEGSQAVALLLGVPSGSRVLDLCAAPGGKTAVLVRAAGQSGSVIACDIHAHRLRATREHLERLGLSRAMLVQVDAVRQLPFAGAFDAILVDAPCSGTGTLARHPEIRWRLEAQDLPQFHELQVKILLSASERVRPGGRLLYSTCSLEEEENDAVVIEVLRRDPSLRRADSSEAERNLQPHLRPGMPAKELLDSEGQLRIFPGAYNSDGFFGALLTKMTGPE